MTAGFFANGGWHFYAFLLQNALWQRAQALHRIRIPCSMYFARQVLTTSTRNGARVWPDPGSSSPAPQFGGTFFSQRMLEEGKEVVAETGGSQLVQDVVEEGQGPTEQDIGNDLRWICFTWSCWKEPSATRQEPKCQFLAHTPRMQEGSNPTFV